MELNTKIEENKNIKIKKGKSFNLGSYLHKIDPVAKTAFFIASLKYMQSEEAHPNKKGLYSDPIMHLFIDQTLVEQAKKLCNNSSGIMDLVAVRHKIILDQLKTHLREPSIKQIVILGSGFDTTAVCEREMLKQAGITVFEIDQSTIIEVKQTIFNEHNTGDWLEHIHYIPCDYIAEDFVKLLSKSGLDFEKSTYVIWEGNIVYLEVEQIKDVLIKIKNNFKNVTVIADCFAPQLLEKIQKENPEVTGVLENFKALNAHFKFNCNLPNLVTQLGFFDIKIISTHKIAQALSKQCKTLTVSEVQQLHEVYTFS